MKKTLVTLLALVFVLSIATAAFAAPNPFVDVPAKHWAYSAVSQLAAAGIIDGYGDGTFKGDKTMTRYEMAQVVAKAMAKSDKANAEQKALIDKLSVEFAAELNNLGVRVAKLEAGASSIKFGGDVRFRYVHYGDAGNELQTRLRVNMAAQVNDNTSFTGSLIAQNHSMDGSSSIGLDNPTTAGDKNNTMNIETAYFTTKDLVGAGTVSVGRQSLYLGQGYLCDISGGFDGILATFGNQVKVTIGYGDIAFAPSISEGVEANADQQMVTVANIGYAVNPNFTLTASMLRANSDAYRPTSNGTAAYNADGNGIFPKAPEFYSFGFNYKLSSDFGLVAEYGKNNNADENNKGWYAQLNYKGADMNVPGSYGLWVGYVRAEDYAIDQALTTLYYSNAGVKGLYGGVSYTLAKNVTFLGEVKNEKYIDDVADQDRDTAYRLYLIYHF